MQQIPIPSYWENLLKGYVKRTFYAGTRKAHFANREEFTEGDYRFFAKGVEQLNIAFTQERGSLPKNYFNHKELRSGYILYFLPVNAIKVTHLLTQIPVSELIPDSLSMNIVDIGCGPGTGMLGTFLYLATVLKQKNAGKLSLQWTLLDQNRQVLNDALVFHDAALAQLRKSLPTWEIDSKVKTVASDIFLEHTARHLPAGSADLILSLNCLSELPRERRLKIVTSLLQQTLKPKGKLLIVEPALRLTTRDLMELHDELLTKKAGVVLAPCLHQAECPMLRENERDWCHTYIPWDRPTWIEKMDQLIGIHKDYPKCSYLLLGRAQSFDGAPAMAFRVVSGPLNSKGKTERLLCGKGALPHLLRAMRLDRDASKENAPFDSLERGDIVTLNLSEKTQHFRILKTMTLRKL